MSNLVGKRVRISATSAKWGVTELYRNVKVVDVVELKDNAGLVLEDCGFRVNGGKPLAMDNLLVYVIPGT